MTVIIAFGSSTHVFLAADSFRWDLLEKRNLGPVRKLTQMGGASWAAIGGSNIDRDRLSAMMAAAHQADEPLLDAARRLSPPLFAETRKIMEEAGSQLPQYLCALYAKADGEACSLRRHDLPGDRLSCLEGLTVAGPDTPWLQAELSRCLPAFTANGEIALDARAYPLIGRAARRHPQAVGYPAAAVMLKANGGFQLRDDLDPRCWPGPMTAFRVPYAQRGG